MAWFRFARSAQVDLASILETSAERWGAEGRQRYAAVLVAAMRQVAAEPEGPLAQKRDELRAGLRSFHLRHARVTPAPGKVRRPVHALFYRMAHDGVVEIVRVLHERMDPRRHLDELTAEDL